MEGRQAGGRCYLVKSVLGFGFQLHRSGVALALGWLSTRGAVHTHRSCQDPGGKGGPGRREPAVHASCQSFASTHVTSARASQAVTPALGGPEAAVPHVGRHRREIDFGKGRKCQPDPVPMAWRGL